MNFIQAMTTLLLITAIVDYYVSYYGSDNSAPSSAITRRPLSSGFKRQWGESCFFTKWWNNPCQGDGVSCLPKFAGYFAGSVFSDISRAPMVCRKDAGILKFNERCEFAIECKGVTSSCTRTRDTHAYKNCQKFI